jgi:hypothetical protein
MMSSEFTRSAYYFFTEIQYYSDHGYVFEQTTIDSKVELSTFYDQTGITYLLSGDKGEDIYFESFWAFETSGVQKVFNRRYKKIQDILPELGGFTNAIRIICVFIMMNYYEYK